MIDCHTHVFPDKIAAKTIAHLSERSGFTPFTDGTLASTKELMQAAGINKFCILPVATQPEQQQAINNFAAACQDNQVFSFGAVHPAASDALDELKRLKTLGLKGLKLHPQYQLTYIDDPTYQQIIRAACNLGLPIIFHAGYDPGLPPPLYAPPQRVANLLDKLADLDNLILIAAHMGGVKEYEQVKELLWGRNIYFDISFASRYLTKSQVEAMILSHSSERFLLGSDCPWQSPAQTVAWLQELALPAAAKEQILSQNALKIWPELAE